MRRWGFSIALAFAGCLGAMPATPGGDPSAGSRTPPGVTVMASPGGDPTPSPTGGPPSPVDGGAPPTDLAGLVSCYGVAICDPQQMFCIKYFSGSQATPGPLAGGPACYEPSDTCANQGQPMDCACIQADSLLGPSCAGACVDNGDGSFSCYAS